MKRQTDGRTDRHAAIACYELSKIEHVKYQQLLSWLMNVVHYPIDSLHGTAHSTIQQTDGRVQLLVVSVRG